MEIAITKARKENLEKIQGIWPKQTKDRKNKEWRIRKKKVRGVDGLVLLFFN